MLSTQLLAVGPLMEISLGDNVQADKGPLGLKRGVLAFTTQMLYSLVQ